MTSSDPFGLVGQVLDGQFRVEAHIGEGGFSIVYRGTHVGLGEPIAVKCLKLPAALGSALVESFVRRFRDESRLQYKLSQGNLHIVRSIGSGTTIAPTTSALLPYTVLEWLDGHSLAHEFNERREAGLHGRPIREVVSLLDTAIDAVAYAHAQGVIHRDLNPGNLFLARTPSGIKLKVLDFGVAKVMADAAIAMGPTARTVGNVRMFAPAYGAPEQFDDRTGGIGPWTDVYAIALVVLEALTDRTVMDGEHLGEFATKALDPATRPTPRGVGAAVGDETEKVLAQALSLDPSRRPHDAGELWGMLKHALQVDARTGRPATAERSGSGESPVTLRMKESRGSVRPPHGGTLRIEPGPPRSATAWLAATPVPSQSPLTPMPPPSELSSQVYFSPAPPRPSVAPLFPRPPPDPPPVTSPAPAPNDAPPPALPRSPAMTIAVVTLVIVALAGAAGFGWRTLHAPPEPPAASP